MSSRLVPGGLFTATGINRHFTPTDLRTTPEELDEIYKGVDFDGRPWPPDSPVHDVYDVKFTSTKMLILNNKYGKEHTRLRGYGLPRPERKVEVERHFKENSPRNMCYHLRCFDSTWELLPDYMRGELEEAFQQDMFEEKLRGYETTYRALVPPHLRLRESFHITYLKTLKQQKSGHLPGIYEKRLRDYDDRHLHIAKEPWGYLGSVKPRRLSASTGAIQKTPILPTLSSKLSASGQDHSLSTLSSKPSTSGQDYSLSIPSSKPSASGQDRGRSSKLSASDQDHGLSAPSSKPSTFGQDHGLSAPSSKPSTSGQDHGLSAPFSKTSTSGQDHGLSVPSSKPSTSGQDHGLSAPSSKPSTSGQDRSLSAPSSKPSTSGQDHGLSAPSSNTSISGQDHSLSAPSSKPSTSGQDHSLSAPSSKPSTSGQGQGLSAPSSKPSTSGQDHGLSASSSKPPTSGQDHSLSAPSSKSSTSGQDHSLSAPSSKPSTSGQDQSLSAPSSKSSASGQNDGLSSLSSKSSASGQDHGMVKTAEDFERLESSDKKIKEDWEGMEEYIHIRHGKEGQNRPMSRLGREPPTEVGSFKSLDILFEDVESKTSVQKLHKPFQQISQRSSPEENIDESGKKARTSIESFANESDLKRYESRTDKKNDESVEMQRESIKSLAEKSGQIKNELIADDAFPTDTSSTAEISQESFSSGESEEAELVNIKSSIRSIQKSDNDDASATDDKQSTPENKRSEILNVTVLPGKDDETLQMQKNSSKNILGDSESNEIVTQRPQGSFEQIIQSSSPDEHTDDSEKLQKESIGNLAEESGLQKSERRTDEQVDESANIQRDSIKSLADDIGLIRGESKTDMQRESIKSLTDESALMRLESRADEKDDESVNVSRESIKNLADTSDLMRSGLRVDDADLSSTKASSVVEIKRESVSNVESNSKESLKGETTIDRDSDLSTTNASSAVEIEREFVSNGESDATESVNDIGDAILSSINASTTVETGDSGKVELVNGETYETGQESVSSGDSNEVELVNGETAIDRTLKSASDGALVIGDKQTTPENKLSDINIEKSISDSDDDTLNGRRKNSKKAPVYNGFIHQQPIDINRKDSMEDWVRHVHEGESLLSRREELSPFGDSADVDSMRSLDVLSEEDDETNTQAISVTSFVEKEDGSINNQQNASKVQ